MSVKVPLYPSKEQIQEFDKLSYCYHKLGNIAVELLKEYGYALKSQGLRKFLTLRLNELPKGNLGFITTVVSQEKVTAYKQHGKVNYHKYSKTHKSFPVRCDENDNRVSRIYSDDLKTIKIPSIPGKVKISYKWQHNMVKKNGVDYLNSLLNYKKQTARVTFDGTYWYLVFSIYYEPEHIELQNKSVGVDVGIEKLAVTSDGIYEYGVNNTSSEIKRLERKEKKLQRILSRKYRVFNGGKTQGKLEKSRNILKLEEKVFLVRRRIKNIRENELHRISKNLVDLNYKIVAFEDLNIKGMMKNKYQAPSIQKQGWCKLIAFTKYKAISKGETFIQVSRWYASSKRCNCCGNIKKDLKLKDRIYKCKKCGLIIDRDYNASLNIRDESLRLVFG